MKAGSSFIALLAVCLTAPAQQKVNRSASILSDFSQQVTNYVKLHNAARSAVHGLKPTNSAAAISRHEHALATQIREARHGAVQGNIFSAEIAVEFRRLIAMTMQSKDAARIRQSLQRAAPAHLESLRVNGSYPSMVPLQSTPPSLLINLPALPPEVEYRVVGHDLVLRDIEANLIVDFIHNAIA